MKTLEGVDGGILRYAHWAAANPEERAGIVVFFQGRTEFIEKNIYVYQDLVRRNYDVWTLDWRGQGYSERMLKDEPEKGHIDHYDTFLQDAEIFIREVVQLDSQEGPNKILLAHSMGGGIGALYLMENPDQFNRAVFSSPLIKLTDDVDKWWVRAGNFLKAAVAGSSCVVSGDCQWTSQFNADFDVCAPGSEDPANHLLDRETAERYSHDADKLAEIECLIKQSRMAAEPAQQSLALAATTSRWLRATFEASDKILKSKDELKTSLLIVSAGDEPIVSNEGQAEFCDIGNEDCCRIVVPGAGHEFLIESPLYRDRFFELFDAFVGMDQGMKANAFCTANH